MKETRSLGAERLQRGLQQLIAREVVGHDIAQTQAFGRGVFDMPHVEINATAVEQETAVARRLFVIAVMQVDRARPGVAEEVSSSPSPARLRRLRPGPAADETAVLRFEPSDPIHFWEARSLSLARATSRMVCRRNGARRRLAGATTE